MHCMHGTIHYVLFAFPVRLAGWFIYTRVHVTIAFHRLTLIVISKSVSKTFPNCTTCIYAACFSKGRTMRRGLGYSCSSAMNEVNSNDESPKKREKFELLYLFSPFYDLVNPLSSSASSFYYFLVSTRRVNKRIFEQGECAIGRDGGWCSDA
jgi:hypothetical protein